MNSLDFKTLCLFVFCVSCVLLLNTNYCSLWYTTLREFLPPPTPTPTLLDFLIFIPNLVSLISLNPSCFIPSIHRLFWRPLGLFPVDFYSSATFAGYSEVWVYITFSQHVPKPFDSLCFIVYLYRLQYV